MEIANSYVITEHATAIATLLDICLHAWEDFHNIRSCVPGDFCGRSGGHASGDEERGEGNDKELHGGDGYSTIGLVGSRRSRTE